MEILISKAKKQDISERILKWEKKHWATPQITSENIPSGYLTPHCPAKVLLPTALGISV